PHGRTGDPTPSPASPRAGRWDARGSPRGWSGSCPCCASSLLLVVCWAREGRGTPRPHRGGAPEHQGQGALHRVLTRSRDRSWRLPTPDGLRPRLEHEEVPGALGPGTDGPLDVLWCA